jgi:predicted dehydrogenase
VLTGTDAVAAWDWNRERVQVASGDDTRTIETPGGVASTYRAELEDFLAKVRAGEPPPIGAVEGAAAVRVAEAIKTSSAERRRVELA